jgi:DNA-3-methyladenine glycosylase I
VNQEQLDYFSNIEKTYMVRLLRRYRKLFKKNFKFTGGEIVGEFFMSIGFLEGAHCKSCTVFDEIIEKRPKWLE